ncbi:MAG: helix-turn-helix domain-containing protein [Nitrososphaerota archaeon]|nr:TrmB family transcriptional regulator [Candidatus Bathyarchaeota archaeon]MDW8193401.1 helix-turn-helix domain-containing protein [Nitrososphaerota archaeon]
MNVKIQKALRRVGLTRYEADAYFILLERGPLTAKQISLGAQIPYSKVYSVLSGLEKKGWVEASGKRPTRYAPRSPEVALKTAKDMLEAEWLKSEKTIVDELMPLYEKMKPKEKYDIWIIRGLQNILSKFKEMVNNCRQEMLIAFPYIPEEFLLGFHQLLNSLFNVNIRFMICSGLDGSVYKILSRTGEVRLRTKMFGGGAISDGNEVLLLFSDEKAEVTAIWSDHPGLAGLAKEYFNYLWRESEGENGESNSARCLGIP